MSLSVSSVIMLLQLSGGRQLLTVLTSLDFQPATSWKLPRFACLYRLLSVSLYRIKYVMY